MELLTHDEKYVIKQTAQLWNDIVAVIPEGPAKQGDLREIVFHIHGIQRAIMSNAAARAYPELYRPLGGDLVGAVPPSEGGP